MRNFVLRRRCTVIMTPLLLAVWPTGERFVLPACGALQKPPAGFYRLFGLDERLAIDLDDLQKRFYELSRKLHPDRYGRKSPTERQFSEEATSILNDAYRTLRDPVKRAEYVLKQRVSTSASSVRRTCRRNCSKKCSS